MIEQGIAKAVVDEVGNDSSMSGSRAGVIMAVWLRARGLGVDRWGKWVDEANGAKYDIAERTFKKFKKGRDGWTVVSSQPLIESAINLVVNAEASLGIVPGVGVKMRDSLMNKAQKAQKARDKKELESSAKLLATKRIAAEEYGTVLGFLSGSLKLSMEKRSEFAKHNIAYLDQARAELEQGAEMPGDAEFVTVDQPPFLPAFMTSVKYYYEVEEGGVKYSVRMENSGHRRMNVHVGRAGDSGFLQVDPSTMQMRMYSGVELKGDGNADGHVEYAEDGTPHASLFLITAKERKKGAGTRLMRIWCQLMKGYGVKQWIGEAVGEEGMVFLNKLAAKGALTIHKSDGSFLLISCS
jgi:hypothetical protein